MGSESSKSVSNSSEDVSKSSRAVSQSKKWNSNRDTDQHSSALLNNNNGTRTGVGIHAQEQKNDNTNVNLPDISREKLLKYLSNEDEWRRIYCGKNDDGSDFKYENFTEDGKQCFDYINRLLTDHDSFYAEFFGRSEKNKHLDDIKQQFTDDDDLKSAYVKNNNNNNIITISQVQSKVLEVLNKDQLEVKLIFTNLEDWKNAHSLTKNIMNKLANAGQFIQNKFGKNAGKYGLVHSALVVGPYIIEWNNSSLVWPVLLTKWSKSDDDIITQIDLTQTNIMERIASNIPILNSILEWFGIISLDLGTIKREKLNNLTTICTEYNKKVKYDAKSCNCQTFVDHALKSLKIGTEFDGNLGRFISNMKSSGKSIMSFNGVLLKTRIDLDNCIKREWSQCNKWDKILLRSFSSMMENERKQFVLVKMRKENMVLKREEKKESEEIQQLDNDVASLDQKIVEFTTILTKDFRNSNKIEPYHRSSILCAIL